MGWNDKSTIGLRSLSHHVFRKLFVAVAAAFLMACVAMLAWLLLTALAG